MNQDTESSSKAVAGLSLRDFLDHIVDTTPPDALLLTPALRQIERHLDEVVKRASQLNDRHLLYLLQQLGLVDHRKYLVWWLTQEHCERITNLRFAAVLPPYLLKLYKDRHGRPGRGRLWLCKEAEADHVAIDDWPDNTFTRFLLDAGGIVFLADDIKFIRSLPGVVTDLKLNRIIKDFTCEDVPAE